MSEQRARLPEQGLDSETVLAEMRRFGNGDVDYRSGRTWSLVYYVDEEHARFQEQAFALYLETNGLNPLAFQSLKRFETEIIEMTADLLHGDEKTVGTVTSGGTESCLLAVKTYRDLARARKPWIRRPEMVAPESVHVAFAKAAQYFNVRLVTVPLQDDYSVDPRALERAITRNTILLVASAPSYPHGLVDPIPEIAEIAAAHGLPLHVDACLGGFMLPFVEQLGYPLPTFDFRLPAVTSISADVHKYGYAPKGISTILYRSVELLRHQIFVQESWSGGIYASAGLLGSRPGGPIAAGWGVMKRLGRAGYLAQAERIMTTTRKLIQGIDEIPELQVIGRPPMSVFAFRSVSPEVDIYAVADRLEARGWHVDRQHRPPSLHLMVMPRHAEVAEQYLRDLAESVAEVRGRPELAEQGKAAVYGMIAGIPLRSLVKRQVLEMMTEMYAGGETNPDLAAAERPDAAGRLGLLFMRLRRRFLRR